MREVFRIVAMVKRVPLKVQTRDQSPKKTLM